MNKKLVIGSIALVGAAMAVALAPSSGLKKGENVSAFHPEHVAGPLANSTKCFPCTFQNRPQAQVWVNSDSMTNVAAIGKVLDKAMEAHKGSEFKAMIVMLTDSNKVAATKAAAKEFATKSGFKNIAISVLSKTDDAVSAYKINLSNDVKNTVVVYKDWKVAASMVNLVADAKGSAALSGAISSVAK